MEIRVPPLIRFMPRFERYEPVIMDSTAMTTFMVCARKYFYSMVLGFRPKDTQPFFAFGAAYHKYREHLSKFYLHEKIDVFTSHIRALEVAMEHWKQHGKTPVVGSRFEFMTAERLKLSCEVAHKHWLEELARKNIEVLAFEQPFTLVMDDGTIIAGRADEIIKVKNLNEVRGRDFKTSSQPEHYFDRNSDPNDQFTRYTYAESKLHGVDVKGQTIEVLFNDKKKGPEIYSKNINKTRSQIDCWLAEHKIWIEMMKVCRDNDVWPMNPRSCWNCEYHQVCKNPSELGQAGMLRTYYKIQPWDCQNVPD